MRLAQEMIVGGALLLDRVANSHLHHLAALASEQLSLPSWMRSTIFSRDVHRSVSFTKVRRGPSSLLSSFLRLRLLVELPCPVRWQGFEGEGLQKSILRKLALFRRSGDPLKPNPHSRCSPSPFSCLVNNHRSHPAGGIKGGYLRIGGGVTAMGRRDEPKGF